MIKNGKDLKTVCDTYRAQREKYFDAQNRYTAAQTHDQVGQPKGVVKSGSGADYHYQSSLDLSYMSERAYDLDRNNVHVSHTVDRLTTNVLQHGFEPEPDVGTRRRNETIKAKWQDWTGNKQQVDVQGEFDFGFLSWLALRSSIIGGDIIGLPLKSGQLQLIESYRIRTPSRSRDFDNSAIVHGVELDRNRKRVRYFIAKDNLNPNAQIAHTDVTPVSAYDAEGNRQVFHVFHPHRCTQTRGVTKLAGVMDYTKMLDDVHFARLVQQQVVSNATFFRERDVSFELPDDVVEEGTATQYDPCSGSVLETQELGAGSMYTGYNGEKLHVLSPNVPNPTFFDHATAIETLIALNLDLPLIVMKMDASQTNFSGWRGAMEQAKIKFRHFQRWYICVWHAPIYRWKLMQWTTPGPLFDPELAAIREAVGDERFFKHSWTTPGWPHVDPAAEQRADVEALGNCLASPRWLARQRGRNWPRLAEEIIEDKVLAIEMAIKEAGRLNKKYDTDIRWSDLIAFPRPQGDNVSDARDVQEDAPEAAAGEPVNAE